MATTMMKCSIAGRPAAARVGGARIATRKASSKAFMQPSRVVSASRGSAVRVMAVRDGTKLDRKLRVAVVGGGPSGACAADDLAKGGVETFMFERKLDNCKVCPRWLLALVVAPRFLAGLPRCLVARIPHHLSSMQQYLVPSSCVWVFVLASSSAATSWSSSAPVRFSVGQNSLAGCPWRA